MYFVIVSISAIAVVSVYSFYNSKRALLDRTFNQLTSVRVVKKTRIEQFFHDRIRELELLSHIDFDGEKVLDPENETPDKKQAYLIDYLRSGGYYEGVYIKTTEKALIFYDLKLSDTSQKAGAGMSDSLVRRVMSKTPGTGGFIIHDYFIDPESGMPRMMMTGSVPGFAAPLDIMIAVEISIGAINTIMLEQNPVEGLGTSGESYLVGNDMLMRTASRFQRKSIMHTKVETEAAVCAFGDITGTEVVDDYRGIKVLSSFSRIHIPGLNWVILAEIDYSEATMSIYHIRNNILMLTIAVAIIVFVISYIFSKKITLPLIKLKDAISNIRKGDFDIALPLTPGDEIGELGGSFNSMAKSLREKEIELSEERNKRITAMIDGQEMERQRLSRELHDGLGQSLVALKLKLESIQGTELCLMNKTLKEVKASFDNTIGEIRRISNGLMPAVLNEFGLVTALKNIFGEIFESSGIYIRFTYDGRYNDLNNRTLIYLFRTIQEALNNIVKHADVMEAEFFLTRQTDLIQVVIRDKGKGMDLSDPAKARGNGIANMKERVRLLNGNFVIHAKPGKGTEINIEIPLTANNNEPD
ncbi:MAG: HAMP domain-containing protein [Bacteroidales bacterium]|nr:HAMP domain-containing protein [Bacteroidales bacterium]